jgi:hypothetical protein
MAMEREDLAEAARLYHESYLWRPRAYAEESPA